MRRYESKNENPHGKWIGIALVLLFTMPQLIVLLLPIGIIGGVVYLVVKNRQSGGAASRTTQRQSQVPHTTYTRRQPAFDECPRSFFCFHEDKGEHHISRGKEIDPWDRPDIDISKYQRRG